MAMFIVLFLQCCLSPDGQKFTFVTLGDNFKASRATLLMAVFELGVIICHLGVSKVF
jgi:hypothetical protein